MTKPYRVLYLHPGIAPPNPDQKKNMLFHLSPFCEGDMVTTIWGTREEYEQGAAAGTFDRLGSFRYHATPSTNMPSLLRSLWNLGFYVRKGLELSHRHGRYDIVLTYGPFMTGLAGWLISRRTGSKLVIEVPGQPTGAFEFNPTLVGRIKRRMGRVLAPFLLRRAHALRLLFSWQLDDLPGGPYPPGYVFPDFVPISSIQGLATAPKPATPGRHVLFLGHPFQLKGVDILIPAFLRIADRHPGVTLKIVGHCRDRAPFERLAGGDSRIEFHKAVSHDEAMALMVGCDLFVLPSRSEGVPRVLMEAMAAGKPVVSTRVCGIPSLVDHGHSGLLCEAEDVEGLADCMDRILSDPDYARGLGKEGQRHILTELTEDRYAEHVRNMLVELAGPKPSLVC